MGFSCFGAEARVPGVEAEAGTLDVGYGFRLDLVGLGRGRDFVEAILAFGTQRLAPAWLRLLILGWNTRSRKVAEACGFVEQRRIESKEGWFLVMLRRSPGLSCATLRDEGLRLDRIGSHGAR